MEPQQCFTTNRNRIYAILNWKERRYQGATIYAEQLSESEEAQYRRLSRAGKSESEIFYNLFPVTRYSSGLDIIELLNTCKAEIAILIQKQLQIALPSLTRMSRRDLLSLYIRLYQR